MNTNQVTPLWRDYLELTKPGVQALLFVSCISGMLIGSSFEPPLQIFIFGLLGISFLAAAAGVINHIFDAEIDAKVDDNSAIIIQQDVFTATPEAATAGSGDN